MTEILRTRQAHCGRVPGVGSIRAVMSDDSQERRGATRHNVYIGAEIDIGDGPVRSAITRDASARGLLLLTRTSLEPEQRVRITVFLKEGERRTVGGRVVRQEALDAAENALWRQKVAFELDDADADLAQRIEELAAAQAATYGS
jgi:hypothetical protein